MSRRTVHTVEDETKFWVTFCRNFYLLMRRRWDGSRFRIRDSTHVPILRHPIISHHRIQRIHEESWREPLFKAMLLVKCKKPGSCLISEHLEGKSLRRDAFEATSRHKGSSLDSLLTHSIPAIKHCVCLFVCWRKQATVCLTECLPVSMPKMLPHVEGKLLLPTSLSFASRKDMVYLKISHTISFLLSVISRVTSRGSRCE